MAVPDREKTLCLLAEVGRGNPAAASELLPHVYEELRKLAGGYFQAQPPGHTLQPTALVHEAYLKLVDQTRAQWKDRSHFVAIAAKAMRQVLVDHFRRREASKRGGEWKRVTLANVDAASQAPCVDFLALEEALARLAALDARQAEVVELRFFGGLSMEEAVEALGVSKRTVEDEWRAARAWLARELRRGEGR